MLVTSNLSFFHRVFKRLVLHTRTNTGCFEKANRFGLTIFHRQILDCSMLNEKGEIARYKKKTSFSSNAFIKLHGSYFGQLV